MKDSFLSKLLGTAGVDTQAVATEARAELQTEFDAFKLQAQEQLSQSASALAAAVDTVKQADAKIAELEAALTASTEAAAKLQAFADAAQAEKTRLAAEAEQKRLDARKAKIVAAVGTAKAEGLMAATLSLDDAAFDAVTSALTVQLDVEQRSSMFTEAGAAAEADATKVVEGQSGVMAILQAELKNQGA